ncbi:uncharacterized protein LOC119326534 isoform X2 [Triticum dicoccoides]|uniref:uncharacterized protein LOC119326534 isoform X2 n=1 Tax=Triticum dicoccoides TaxID=85692 RepID=UPI001891175A|nr:uncharacterized protein LOC119326534 isoform X2 [Triticum dicoccoides]
MSSLILVFYPVLHYVHTGDFEATIKLWDCIGIQIALLNSILWLLYGIVVLKRDSAHDVIISNSLFCGVNLAYLLMICGYEKKKIKAYLWFTGTMLFLLMALIILQVEIEGHPAHVLEYVFGVLALYLLGSAHAIQMYQLFTLDTKMELLTVLMTIMPSCIFCIVQAIVTFISHKNQRIMVISSSLNLVCYGLEILLLIQVHKKLKAPEAIKKLKSTVGRSFRRRQDEAHLEDRDQPNEGNDSDSNVIPPAPPSTRTDLQRVVVAISRMEARNDGCKIEIVEEGGDEQTNEMHALGIQSPNRIIPLGGDNAGQHNVTPPVPAVSLPHAPRKHRRKGGVAKNGVSRRGVEVTKESAGQWWQFGCK